MVNSSPTDAAPPTTSTPALELRSVTLSEGQNVIFSRVNLSFPIGTLATIVGPPGAGKSVLMRCLAGRLEPRAGESLCLGQETIASASRLAFVQQNGLTDWRFPLSVNDVVRMGLFKRLRWLQRPSRQQQALVMQTLTEVGLEQIADRRVAGLDSSQRCRVLLARALVQQPDVLLLDSLLDATAGEVEEDIFSLIRRIRDRGRTVVIATRQLERVAERYEQVVLVNGRVVDSGRPACVLTRENLRAAYGSWPLGLPVQADYFAVDA